MSFLGAIGTIMAGLGIHELFELIYAPNAVTHMLSGKAVSRAVRAHLLVAGVLHAILVSKAFSVELETYGSVADNIIIPSTSESGNSDIDHLAKLYDSIMDGSEYLDNICSDEILQNVCATLSTFRNVLQKDKTPALWLQYMDMVGILCKFLKAERTGNWSLHLGTLYEMLPYLAAAGHNHYTKSVYLYLQKMSTLEIDHPNVYRKFMSGFHVVRREIATGQDFQLI